jgi:hypothetical protein
MIPEGPLGTRFKSVMMDDRIEAVEGLIVDARHGFASVGFRNHTLPATGPLGATWKEVLPFECNAYGQDILFIEPQTVCIGTSD